MSRHKFIESAPFEAELGFESGVGRRPPVCEANGIPGRGFHLLAAVRAEAVRFLRGLFCEWPPWPATHPRAQKHA